VRNGKVGLLRATLSPKSHSEKSGSAARDFRRAISNCQRSIAH